MGYISLGVIQGPASILPVILYAILYCKARKMRMNPAMAAAGASDAVPKWKATITFFLLFVTVFLAVGGVTVVTQAVAAVIRATGPSPYLFVLSAVVSCLYPVLVISDPIVIMRNGECCLRSEATSCNGCTLLTNLKDSEFEL